MTGHRYYLASAEGTRPWGPHDPADVPLPDCVFLGGVFRELERHWDGDPLTVYVTKDTTSLPSYGPNVVSVLLNEEWFRTPAYSGVVLAVLRNLPGRPWFAWESLAPPSVHGAFALANHLRILAERARSLREGEGLRRARGWPPVRTDNTVDIPLGYFRQPERPIVPMEQRATDVYFGGSLIHDLGRKERYKQLLKRAIGNPKQLYRQSMLDEVARLRDRHPEIRAKITISGEFRELGGGQISDYASDMMDARVALVPRGTAAESYRLFEAWRYGCVVICEGLPPRPFLHGAPVITLRRWSELEPVLVELLADEDRLRALHEASLAWWREVCAEEPTGRRVAARLAELARGRTRISQSDEAPAGLAR